MLGAFYCPDCKTPNACTCETCKPHIKDDDVVGTFKPETIVCGKCGREFSYGEALDTEYELIVKPLFEQLNNASDDRRN